VGKSCTNLEAPHQPFKQKAGVLDLVTEAAAAVHKTAASVYG
jgi:hypothetical protein